MTRQYIGARYVPIFFDGAQGTEWLPNTQYEPLTIVTRNGNSYTSRKLVPAAIGAPENNAAYWASTGIYNAQLETVRQEINDLSNRTDANETDIDSLESDVTELQGHHKSKFIFIGDSYANPNYGNWENPLAIYLRLGDEDCLKLYRDGVSFFDDGFIAVLQDAAAELTAEERAEYGHIVVLGGLNDAQTQMDSLGYDVIGQKIGEFCSYARTAFPNAVVQLGFIGNSISTSGILMGRDDSRIVKAFAQWAKCGARGAQFLSGLEYVLHDYSLMRPDGIHPTIEGGTEIARYAASAIYTGSADVKRRYKTLSADFYDSTGATSGITVGFIDPQFVEKYFDIYQDNAVTSAEMMFRMTITFETATEMTLGKQLILGKFNFNLWNGKPSFSVPVEGSMLTSGGDYVSYKGHMILVNGTMYLRMDQAGDNWNSHPVVTQILILPFHCSIPTMLT